MKTKQIIGIVVAAIMFILVCLTSVLTEKVLSSTSKIFGDSLSSEQEGDLPSDDYVGVLKVEGAMADLGSSSSIFEEEGYNHRELLKTVDEYMDDKVNKGILLYVNSPGGTVNAADELYLKLMEYKQVTKRPIYVYMADEACSGGYYVSVAGDKIFANRNTWTGSIGVYLELANYKGLYDKLGIKTTYIKAGKNKTMGSATQDLTLEQAQILQSLVDESYEQFVGVIAAGRKNMTEQQIRVAADGRIYSSAQAKKVGLIDDIMDYEGVKELVKSELGGNIEIYEEDNSSSSFWDFLYSKMNVLFKSDENKKSDTQKLLEYVENHGSGVPMYYAKPGM